MAEFEKNKVELSTPAAKVQPNPTHPVSLVNSNNKPTLLVPAPKDTGQASRTTKQPQTVREYVVAVLAKIEKDKIGGSLYPDVSKVLEDLLTWIDTQKK